MGQKTASGAKRDVRRVRNLRAAFDEIRRGLATWLRSHPHRAVRARVGPVAQGEKAGSPDRASPSGDLCLETTIHLLRLLLLLHADAYGLVRFPEGGKGRALRGLSDQAVMAAGPSGRHGAQGDGYRLWDAVQGLLGRLSARAGQGEAACSFPLMDLRSAGMPTALKVPDANLLRALRLLGLRPGRGLGSKHSTDGAAGIQTLGDAYEAVADYVDRCAGSLRESRRSKAASLRKRTGRYYTPESVVKYVVRGALGRRLRGLSSKQILRLRVLDPAMGAGHFLLGVAEFLAVAHARARLREGGMSRLIHKAHYMHAVAMNRDYKCTGHLWENRFYSTPLDEEHLINTIRYIEWNPVSAGLCEKPCDYLWSSARDLVTGNSNIINLDYNDGMLNNEGWQAILSYQPEEAVLKMIRKNTISGRPAGSMEFIRFIENKLGRTLPPQRRIFSKI